MARIDILTDKVQEKEKKVKSMQKASDLATSYADLLEARASGEIHHIKSGFTDLDEKFGGWLHEGHLIVIAGRPGMGKTVLAQQIAEYISNTKTALFFTLEMSSYELVERSVARQSGVTIQDLKTTNIKEKDWIKVSNAIVNFGNLHLLIDDGTFSIAEIVNKSKSVSKHLDSQIKQSDDVKPLGAIVVDYLQLISGKGVNRTIEVGQITTALKRLSKELKVPVIALSQLNRNLESRPNKRPNMSDLRESGQIEQDADMIFFIYRDEYYNEDSQEKGIAEIIGAKNRHGATGTVRTAFSGERVRFSDLVHDFSPCNNNKRGVNTHVKKRGRSNDI